MPKYRLALAAKNDIATILIRTHEQFGEQARLRYEELLIQAMCDVAARPDLPGSHGRSEIIRTARTYHLSHSRDHVPSDVGRVKRPRHFLLYRTLIDGTIEIGRVLHDAIDLSRYLPNEYRPDTTFDNDNG